MATLYQQIESALGDLPDLLGETGRKARMVLAIIDQHDCRAVVNASLGGAALCVACGARYLPSKKPSSGRRNYCPECRARKIPQRDAAADYRQRLRERG